MLQCSKDENIQKFNTLRVKTRKLIRRKKREAYSHNQHGKGLKNNKQPSVLQGKKTSNQPLQNNKACGSDNITYVAIQGLLGNIWRSETLTEEWNEGIIIPIHKNCKNYRAITLLSRKYKGEGLSCLLFKILLYGYQKNQHRTRNICKPWSWNDQTTSTRQGAALLISRNVTMDTYNV